jgi:ABC-2 type transport system permease protein
MSALTTIPDVIAVRVPERSWRSELRAVKIVWRRELTRFVSDKAGMVAWLVQPLLFLFVLGSGLQQLAAASTGGVDLKTFIFPGMLSFAVVFTAMFSAITLVMDRELGVMREMLVAPVSRSSILLGKALGGTTVAASQGVVMLALAGLVDVPYDPLMLAALIVLLTIAAFTVTAFGLMVATRIKNIRTFTSIMQLFVFPLIFLSGSLFPVANLPTWLELLNRINPLTYVVDPMRRIIFDQLDISDGARATLAPGVSWFGWTVPVWLEVALVLALGLVLMGVAVRQFTRAE